MASVRVEPNPQPVPEQRRHEVLAAPGFGRVFTDHLGLVDWSADRGWHDPRVVPYAPLSLDPATAVLHYAQCIFEGFKAYRQPDGGVATFRPQENARRFRRSARRLALPELPEELFLDVADTLVRTDAAWVPDGEEMSLYVRPFMLGTEVGLGVRPSAEALFCVVASPAAAYFPGGVKPVTLWLSQKFSRAAPGGTGAAKCGGNYAASLVAQQEAGSHGCDQVVFLDALEHRWLEELGGMNLFLVLDDGTLVTPELSGTILEGVTRESVVTIAGDLGHKVDERRVDVEEWREGVASGRVTEVFACGTAAVITPVGALRWPGGEARTPQEGIGPVAAGLRQVLLDVQYGRAPDPRGWRHRLL